MQIDWRSGLKWLLAAAVLALVLMAVDRAALWQILRQADPGWLLLALAVSVAQVVLSAWRWRYTAGRLGLRLGLTTAVKEYYLSTLLNQLLPGGVLGDAGRAVRHGLSETPDARGTTVRAVIIERLSGQLVLFPVVLLALWWAPLGIGDSATGWLSGMGNGAAWWSALLIIAGLGLTVFLLRWARVQLLKLGRDIRQSLLHWPALPIQSVTSLLVISSYIVVFWLVAQALQITTLASVLLPLIPLTLLAMLVPFTVSGWGVREGAAAALWALSGLPAAEGVAISVGYGLVILAASLPGLWVLLRLQVKQQVRPEIKPPVGRS